MIFLIALSLIALSMNLAAKERRGAELEILKNDGHPLNGELIAVKKGSIVLLESSSGADISISMSEIRNIKIVGKSKTFRRATEGFLVGAITGAAIGAISGSSDFSRLSPKRAAVLGGVVCGLAGILLGTVIALEEGADKTIQIAGKSEAEIRSALADLRSRARVRGFS